MRDALLVIRAAVRLYVRRRLAEGVDAGLTNRDVRNPLPQFRTWLRCMWRTGGTHDLDLCTGRCRHCRKRWADLYPDDRAPIESYPR